jgi:hypothetical protein
MQEEDLKEARNKLVESLEKAAHYWKDKDPAKYKAMLGKLRSDRKKVGHKEKATQMVLQAKRRERGGKGTKSGSGGTSGHSSGKMQSDTGSAVKRIQGKEKKTGANLSLDRKNNMRGYEGKNTRLVPQKMNQGRHHVDGKKLKNWKKKLKKTDLEQDQFLTLLRSKLLEKGYGELADLIKVIDIDRFIDYIDVETVDESSSV